MQRWLPLIGFLCAGVLTIASLNAAQGKQTFTGTITDSICAMAVHTGMRMGPTDADCTVACVAAHDGDYVLYDGKTAYILSDSQKSEQFAGQKVTVIGTLDLKTRKIQVDSITATK